ncbi:MAG: ATPase, partial [Spirochaetes bacterium]|nr:ATPase [Spirochaetota bacterium]
LLLYIKGPLHFMKQKKVNGKRFTILTLLNFAMEWVVEILEVFGGYLSNTLSFMRVAGLGIAHASLMIAFFKISRMVNPGGGPVYFNILSILILIFGNILVIGLEGLTAGIQALRLNYYEFFTKFFSGFGEMYSPVSLKSRD